MQRIYFEDHLNCCRQHELLDCDWLEWRVDVRGWGRGHFALIRFSDGKVLQLEIEADVHPHEVDGHRHQAQAEVLGVDADHDGGLDFTGLCQ